MNMGMAQISKQLKKKWLEIRGTVKVGNFFGKKRIAILERGSLKVLNIAYSDKVTGKWFWRIDESKYSYKDRLNAFLVLAIDDSKTYNAQVYDYITPVRTEITLNLL